MSRSRYSSDVDPSDINSAHGLIVRLVGWGKRVLDVGCAEGDLARALADRDCRVWGVDSDVAAAHRAEQVMERVVVGDIEQLDLVAEFGEGSFDVVLFGDVLEHLRDPATVLRRALGVLAPSGFVVVSVPNVSHAALRLSLFLGRWDYRPTGLLDDSHIRFFTRQSLTALLEANGLVPVQFENVVRGPFETEIELPREQIPEEALRHVLSDRDATAYQFVVMAAPDDLQGRLRRIVQDDASLRVQYQDLAAESEDLRAQMDDLRGQLGAARHDASTAMEAVTRQERENARLRDDLRGRESEADRLREEVRRLAEQLGLSTELLRREERTVVKPLLRRAYRGARRIGQSLPPEGQRRVRAGLAPLVRRAAPGSPQAFAYERARTGAGAPLAVGPGGQPVAGSGTAVTLGPKAADGFDFVLLPVIDWHFRIQRPQHIALELGRRGHRVVYLSTEFDRLRPGKSAYSVLEQVADSVVLARLACASPLPRIYRDEIAPHQVDVLAEALDLLVDELGLDRVVLIAQHPFWEPLMRASGHHALVYDLMDDHTGFDGAAPWLNDAEARLIAAVDLVTVTSPSLAEKAAGSVVVRNAADVDTFAGPPPVVHERARPTVGYFGAISHWFDTGLVERCATTYPDWDFVLIGSTEGAYVDGLRRLPNVELLGELAYDRLPAHLHGFDVCIIPFHITPLTEHTNPVKAYEYLSAGKPVVATGMPEVRLMQPYVHVADNGDAFVALLAEAMRESGDDALAQHRRDWVRQHSWAARTEQLEDALQDRLPSASVVVLCHNNLDFTRSCLDSLDRLTGYPRLQVVVVDNASTDGTVEYLREFADGRPEVTLVLNDENLGFAAGNNAGLAASSGDVLVMLNNDTVVTEGWLLGLTRHLRDNPGLGLVGPVTNNIGNEAKVDVQYTDLAGLKPAARAYTSLRFRQLIRVPTVAFFCAAMRREVYEKVGGLDEAFGVGFFEDDDYCRRVQAAGYEIAIAEDVFVHHHLSASFDSLGAARKQELFEKSKAVYEAKWGPWTPHAYRPGERP